MKDILIMIFVACLMTACTPKTNVVQNTSTKQTNSRTLPKQEFSVDKLSNGNYEMVDLSKDELPQPIQGNTQWYTDFYGEIRYPAHARENGIQGVVIIEIEVDSKGMITSSKIKQGLSSDLDKEAMRVFTASTMKGFEPYTINGNAVPYRLEIPVGFWLQ